MIDGKVDNFEDGDIYNSLGFTWESVSGEPRLTQRYLLKQAESGHRDIR